jgi:hypothetical protein
LRHAQRAFSHLYDLVLVPMHIRASQFVIPQAITNPMKSRSTIVSHLDFALISRLLKVPVTLHHQQRPV